MLGNDGNFGNFKGIDRCIIGIFMNVIAGDQTAVIGQNYIGVSNVDMGIRQGKQFADQLFRLVRFNSVFAENLIMVDRLRSVQEMMPSASMASMYSWARMPARPVATITL